MIRVSLSNPHEVVRTVKVEGGDFKVKLKAPTAEDLLKDRAFLWDGRDRDEVWRFRLGFLTGWEDLQDEHGAPVEFNPRTMEAVLRNPEVLTGILNELYRLFNLPLTEEQAKN